MLTIRRFAPILLAVVLRLVSGTEVHAQGHTWIIKSSSVKGRWEYQQPGTAALRIEARPEFPKYFGLRSEGKVRCLETRVETCQLFYLSEGADLELRLDIKGLRKDQWVTLDTADPPHNTVLPPQAQISQLFQKPRGGSRSASGCGGDFPLKAPACGETVDLSSFDIQWLVSDDTASGSVAIRIERVDGERRTFRDVARTSAGKYAADKLLDFFAGLQGRNNVVDVSLTVEDGARKAVRLVHIPPSIRTDEYRQQRREAESKDPLVTTMRWMSLAMAEEMWSEAASRALRLLELAPDVPEVKEYALAGLCRSDFEREKGLLRAQLDRQVADGICPATGGSESLLTARNDTTPQLSPSIGTGNTKGRVGIALVIGNSAYWNVPLNSVKSDTRQMTETLTALGFEVVVRENLAEPRQFQEAVLTLLKTKVATPDDILLVYFSGHGLQIDGKAQLLGIGVPAEARSVQDVRANAQSVEELLADMERAGPNKRILIVDACRDNIFPSDSALGGQNPRAGFAFQQDDVPNTVVMFANRPGLPAPARSDYGLMGPFTESLVYALNNSSGDIQEVFALAQRKTAELSPGQQPVLYSSKKVEPIVFRQKSPAVHVNRAVELLSVAESYYEQREWKEFIPIIERARVFAEEPQLRERLNNEISFANAVIAAEHEQSSRNWIGAASDWEKAFRLFPARQWLAMNAAVAYLMADEIVKAFPLLSEIAAQSAGGNAQRAEAILSTVVAGLPEYAAEVTRLRSETRKPSGPEFERLGGEGEKKPLP
jgi:hypothetical protein